jgi:organic hydroperoxide reductase OsmC/OhrA
MSCACDEASGGTWRLDLVWDEDLDATTIAPNGTAVRIGPAATLPPEQLMAFAVSSCLMTAFLELAAGANVPIQGYVSSARIVRDTPGADPALALVPCVVVQSDSDRARLDPLWAEAVRRSPMLQLLGAHLQVEPAVRVVPPA